MRVLTAPLIPARAIMDRLSFAWKFAVIALVLLTPLAFVTWSYLGVQQANTDFSAKERVGVRYILPGTDVVADVVAMRAAAVRLAGNAPGARAQLDAASTDLAGSLAKLAAADARDGAELQTTKLHDQLVSDLKRVSETTFTSPNAAYDAWNELTAQSLGLVLQAGNISNLILDPDLDTYYLMDNEVIRIVTLMDFVGQAADVEQVIELEQLSDAATFDRRLELSRILGAIDFNHATLEGNYVVSLDSTDQPEAWEALINDDLAAYQASAKQVRANIDAAVNGTTAGAAAVKLAAANRADLVTLQGSTSAQLDALIEDRIGGFTAARQTTLIISTIALILAALLFGGFYQSVRAALRNLLAASERIGRGELGSQLNVSSRDEIGRMADSFRVMSDNLRETADAAKQISKGDVHVSVPMRSEHDELGAAFQEMVTYLQETAHIAERLSQGDLSVQARPRSERDALSSALQETVTYLRGMSDTAGVEFADLGVHISQQALAADRIADGDLTIDVAPRSDRDVLGLAFQRMTDNLREVIGDIAENAIAVSAASEQLSSTSREVTSEMEAATAQIGDLEGGVSEQLRLLDQVTSGANDANNATERVVERSTGGRESMGAASSAMAELEQSATDVNATMQTLEEHGRRIDAIIGTITAISDQTNLLALNAAIEAARAGDAGRGFAVVADEVRKLAEESQNAAQSVAEIVMSMQHETTHAVSVIERTARQATDSASLVQRAQAAFDEIDDAVRDAGARVEEIQHDAVDAGDVTRRASESTARVGHATSQTTASMQEVSASSSELARLAEDLTRTTGRFRITREDAPVQAAPAATWVDAA